jgi:low temperature requirement protein LtrA
LSIGLEIAILSWRRGQIELYGRLAPEHVVERVGLFLVIVLGESVFGVVTALAAHFTWPSATAALGGLVIASILAIGFFHWGSATAEEGFTGAQGRGAYEIMREAVMYLPFVLVSSVIVLAAALTEAVSEPTHVLPTGHRYGLSVGIAGYYLANAAIAWRLGGDGRDILRWAIPSVVLAAGVVLPVAAIAPAWAAVAAGAVLCAAIIGLGRLNNRRATLARV